MVKYKLHTRSYRNTVKRIIIITQVYVELGGVVYLYYPGLSMSPVSTALGEEREGGSRSQVRERVVLPHRHMCSVGAINQCRGGRGGGGHQEIILYFIFGKNKLY